MVDTSAPLELLLIHAGKPCPTCVRTRQTLAEVVARSTRAVTVREITTDDPEAGRYGAVITPMVVLSGRVLSAGMAPLAGNLLRIIGEVEEGVG